MQHLVDQARIRLGIGIADEAIDLFRCRRQPEHVEINPANQAYAICPRRGLDAAGTQLFQHERIDGPRDPGILDRRRSNFLDGLERPVRGRDPGGIRRRTIRHLYPLIDPGPQQPDLPVGKRFALRRHDGVGIQAGDEFDQAALVAMACHDRRLTGVAAVDQAVAKIYAKTTLLLLRAMTFAAPLLQNRLDVTAKVDGLLGGRRKRFGNRRAGRSREPDGPQRGDGHGNSQPGLVPFPRDQRHWGSSIVEINPVQA